MPDVPPERPPGQSAPFCLESRDENGLGRAAPPPRGERVPPRSRIARSVRTRERGFRRCSPLPPLPVGEKRRPPTRPGPCRASRLLAELGALGMAADPPRAEPELLVDSPHAVVAKQAAPEDGLQPQRSLARAMDPNPFTRPVGPRPPRFPDAPLQDPRGATSPERLAQKQIGPCRPSILADPLPPWARVPGPGLLLGADRPAGLTAGPSPPAGTGGTTAWPMGAFALRRRSRLAERCILGAHRSGWHTRRAPPAPAHPRRPTTWRAGAGPSRLPTPGSSAERDAPGVPAPRPASTPPAGASPGPRRRAPAALAGPRRPRGSDYLTM